MALPSIAVCRIAIICDDSVWRVLSHAGTVVIELQLGSYFLPNLFAQLVVEAGGRALLVHPAESTEAAIDATTRLVSTSRLGGTGSGSRGTSVTLQTAKNLYKARNAGFGASGFVTARPERLATRIPTESGRSTSL